MVGSLYQNNLALYGEALSAIEGVWAQTVVYAGLKGFDINQLMAHVLGFHLTPWVGSVWRSHREAPHFPYTYPDGAQESAIGSLHLGSLRYRYL